VYDIKLPFKFNKVLINSSELNYSEKDLKTSYIWNLSFNNLNGSINNFSNDIDALKANQKVNIELECLLNKKAVTKLHFTLDYIDKSQPFFVKGLIKNYNLKDLNPILSNLSSLEVANCDLRNLKFVMQGNKTQLYSNITMIYNNLRVRVLERDAEDQTLKKNAWFSFIANSVLLNNDNPKFNGKTIHPKFNIQYQKDYSFFGYLWKALFKGVKESVGVSEKMEKELKYRSNRIKEIKAYKEVRKVKKEIRKAKRFERRKLVTENSTTNSSSEKQL
jgi:hypothetical protein